MRHKQPWQTLVMRIQRQTRLAERFKGPPVLISYLQKHKTKRNRRYVSVFIPFSSSSSHSSSASNSSSSSSFFDFYQGAHAEQKESDGHPGHDGLASAVSRVEQCMRGTAQRNAKARGRHVQYPLCYHKPHWEKQVGRRQKRHHHHAQAWRWFGEVTC